jgi:anti-sigma factor RsiW
MNSSDHPSFSRLTDLVQGRLAAEERDQLDAHLSTCAQCGPTMTWLRRVTNVMRAGALEDPPISVVNRATRLLRLRTGPQEARPSLVRRILAVLSFDTTQAAGQLALGFRSGEQGALRQMLFVAEDRQVQLRVRSAAHGWLVAGQVLGSCEGGPRAELRGPTSVEAELNEVCEFSLPEVPPGVYTLLVHLGDVEIEVPDLALGV